MVFGSIRGSNIKMTKNVHLQQITLDQNGMILLKFMKEITDPDTGEIIFSEPHRTSIGFETDIQEQLESVYSHLTEMKYPIDEQEKTRIISTTKSLFETFIPEEKVLAKEAILAQKRIDDQLAIEAKQLEEAQQAALEQSQLEQEGK